MRNRVYKEIVNARLGDRKQSCARYNLGYSSLTEWAKRCGAIRRFGSAVRYDWAILDADLDRQSKEA